jgi:hypothetical protein
MRAGACYGATSSTEPVRGPGTAPAVVHRARGMAPEPSRPALTLSAAFDNHSRAPRVGRGAGVGSKHSRDRQGLDAIQVWRTHVGKGGHRCGASSASETYSIVTRARAAQRRFQPEPNRALPALASCPSIMSRALIAGKPLTSRVSASRSDRDAPSRAGLSFDNHSRLTYPSIITRA